MAITGHKTRLVFTRYHTMDAGDLTRAIWTLDTQMDTTARPELQAQLARSWSSLFRTSFSQFSYKKISSVRKRAPRYNLYHCAEPSSWRGA